MQGVNSFATNTTVDGDEYKLLRMQATIKSADDSPTKPIVTSPHVSVNTTTGGNVPSKYRMIQ